MRILPILAVVAFIAAGAWAGEADVGFPRIHVDVAKVVEQGSVAVPGKITSSGQPSEAALKVFADAGYEAVIDLRGPDEDRGYDEASAVEAAGLDYVTLPVLVSDGISVENAEKLDTLIEQYDGPVLVHCGSGNRVGALLAISKSLDGADDEEAIAYGRSAGLTRLERITRERLANTDE